MEDELLIPHHQSDFASLTLVPLFYEGVHSVCTYIHTYMGRDRIRRTPPITTLRFFMAATAPGTLLVFEEKIHPISDTLEALVGFIPLCRYICLRLSTNALKNRIIRSFLAVHPATQKRITSAICLNRPLCVCERYKILLRCPTRKSAGAHAVCFSTAAFSYFVSAPGVRFQAWCGGKYVK